MTALKIKYPKSTQFLLLLGATISSAAGIFLIYYTFQIEYFQIPIGCFGLLLLAFGISCLEDSTKTMIINEEGITSKTIFRKKHFKTADIKGYGEVKHPTNKRHYQNYQTQLVLFFKNKKHLKMEAWNWGDQYPLLLKSIKAEYAPVKQVDKYTIIQQRKDFYKNIGKGIGVLVVLLGMFLLFTQGMNSNPMPEILIIISGMSIIFYYQYVSKGYD